MTLFSGDSLVISLPGAEAARLDPRGTVQSPEEVLANELSPALRAALNLLCEHAAQRQLPVYCVLRPEMFTNKLALGWLRQRISRRAQHVCLSDGSTIKYLANLPTHVFFYDRSGLDLPSALRILTVRAPDLMASLRGQVNSRLSFRLGKALLHPASLFLAHTMPTGSAPAEFYSCFLNTDSAEDSAAHLIQADMAALQSREFLEARYLMLGDTALQQRTFSQLAAETLLRTYFEPHCLLIVCLPQQASRPPSMLHGLTSLLGALRLIGATIPRAPAPNILFSTSPVEEDFPPFLRCPPKLLLHETFSFWQHTTEFYLKSPAVTIVPDRRRSAAGRLLPPMLEQTFGPNAHLLAGPDDQDSDDA